MDRPVEAFPPARARWEVLLLDPPESAPGAEGVLLVVEEGTGHVRAAEVLQPGASLWPTLSVASFSPRRGCASERPRVLVCDDLALSARLRRDLPIELGTWVEIEHVLPFAVEAVAALRGSFARPVAWTLATSRQTWADVLTRFALDTPWETLPPWVELRFRSGIGELDDAVGTVLGHTGAPYGFALCPSAAAHERYRLADYRGLPPHGLCVSIDLDHPVAWHPDDRMTRFVATRDGARVRPTEREQAVVHAALDATLDLLRSLASPGVVLREPCTGGAHTSLGPVLVAAQPSRAHALPSFLVGVGFTGAVVPSAADDVLALELAPRVGDALRLAVGVTLADRVRITPVPGHLDFVVLCGGREIGSLGQLDDTMALRDRGTRARSVELCLLRSPAQGSAPYELRRTVPLDSTALTR
jgi:hypothetical protein